MREAGVIANDLLDPDKPGLSVQKSNVRKKTSADLWWVLALTAISGVLCFNQLSHPSMLIDECFTYWRICGTQGQLLDTLRNDGFVPLHYELLNWIRQGFPLGFGVRIVPGGIFMTPAAMRFVPALSGTLMTPVMYFLALQIFNRRAARIAGLFIACSAYGLFFSHYAKMYAPAWMLVTLSIACCIWWIRSWKRIAWLCWVASGIAAAGFHAITLLLLPLSVLYFVSMGRFRGWRVPLLVWGILLITIGPAVYYGCFNQWTQNSGGIAPGVVGKTNPEADWRASGLNWLDSIDNSFDAPFEALNNYLSGFDWKTLDDLEHPAVFVEKYGKAMVALAVATYGVFAFGSLPWAHLRKTNEMDRTAQPWWRSLLWILLWLVMPVYGFFYCRSVPDFSSPWVWVMGAFDYVRAVWWQSLVGAIVVAAFLAWLPRAAKFVAISLLLIGAGVVALSAWDKFQWMDYLARPLILIEALALVCGAIFHYSGSSFRQRVIELARLMGVVATVLGLCGVMYFGWRWMHDVSMRKHPDLEWQSIWHVRYVAIVWPAVWLAAAGLVSRLPTKGVRIGVVAMICSYNLANGLTREYASSEMPLDRAMADVYASQPNSPTRTYFELHEVLNDTLYRPLALYNACIAARMETTPEDFRVGSSWPFEFGRAAELFRSRCIYNNSISTEKIRDDLKGDPTISRVIVWEVSRFGDWDWPDEEAAKAGLSGKWVLASNEEIATRWNWDWSDRWWFRRREFRKIGGGPWAFPK